MRPAPRPVPLTVTLQWDDGDIQSVGRLGYIDRVARFEYDNDFLTAGLEISPVHHRAGIAPGLIRPYDATVFDGLHGVFHDSLPDGWGRLLVDRRARELGIDPATLTPIDRLAWVGDRGIGALSYAPDANAWNEGESALDLDRLAADVRNVLAGHVSDVIAELGHLGGSPGGARPKVMVAIDRHDGAVHGSTPPGGDHQHYLVKFRGNEDPEDAANIEQAYADMARAAGVRVPETRLIPGTSGQHYFASRRFDRDGTRRIHAHTASGLLYADYRLPSLDYSGLIALTRSVTRDRREVAAMFALAAFNVLAHNRDDHARQFTFLMERDGLWRLAPAYDLTFSTGPGGEHSTTVLGQGRQIDRHRLLELGKYADLSAAEAERIVGRVAAAVADWDRFARERGVGFGSRTRIARRIAVTTYNSPPNPAGFFDEKSSSDTPQL